MNNNQPMNNNMNNNYNNGFNNNNNFNQSNGYNGNAMNQGMIQQKKFDIKKIAIIAGVGLVVVFLGSKLLGNNSGTGGGSLFGGHKNMTGSTEYKDSDVGLNCTKEDSNDKRVRRDYSDFIFNYKYGNGPDEIFQAREYGKIVLEYKNTLTDDEYQRVIDEIGCLAYCNDVDNCTDSHIECSISDIGIGTVIDRIGNKIEMTFHLDYGNGRKITKEEIKKMEDNFEDGGYDCN